MLSHVVVDPGAGDRRSSDRPFDPRRSGDQAVVRSAAERWMAAAIFVAATALVAIIGAIVTQQGLTWYHRSGRTPLVPRDAVFAPVWFALHAINAVAGYLAWRSSRRRAPTVAWAVALGINLLWTLIFFGAHRPGPGLLVIVALGVAIAVFAITARPYDTTATWLMLPYLSWVTFAALLDVAIIRST